MKLSTKCSSLPPPPPPKAKFPIGTYFETVRDGKRVVVRQKARYLKLLRHGDMLYSHIKIQLSRDFRNAEKFFEWLGHGTIVRIEPPFDEFMGPFDIGSDYGGTWLSDTEIMTGPMEE